MRRLTNEQRIAIVTLNSVLPKRAIARIVGCDPKTVRYWIAHEVSQKLDRLAAGYSQLDHRGYQP